MRDIKNICKKIKNNLSEVIATNSLSAVLLLSNLVYFIKTSEGCDLSLANETLSDVKSKLTAKEIQRLWETISTLSPDRYKVMDVMDRKAITGLKHAMLCDRSFFEHLTKGSLINLGQHVEFYREVLVALIRQHLYENNKVDPFSSPTFSYELLKEGSTEQNARYLGSFVKVCASLPVDTIIEFGSSNCEIASSILIDLKEGKEHLSISSRFAYLHPELRKEIATEMKCYLETMPIHSEERKVLDVQLPRLQSDFPTEFSVVNREGRVKRNNQVVAPYKKKTLMRTMCEGTVEGIASSLALPAYLLQFGLVLSIPAPLITIPACIGFTYAFGYMRSKLKDPAVDIKFAQPIAKLDAPRM